MKRVFCDLCDRETPEVDPFRGYAFHVTNKGKEITVAPFFQNGHISASNVGGVPSPDLCVDCARYLCGIV